jgi:DNA uptake protein ComE-like DNA-binding protein
MKTNRYRQLNNKILLYGFLLLGLPAMAQEKEISSGTEQQLEDLVQTDGTAINDDSYVQQQEYFKNHPLNMNTATSEELNELGILSGLQLQQFLLYRRLLGKLLSPYELQAVPSWDIATIKNLLPFIIVADDRNLVSQMKERWKGGDNILLARYGRVMEKSKGYDKPADSAGNHYLGSAAKIYFRYSYNYKDLLQWGLLGDKDAGEQFFKGRQQWGFDFYSFHFFLRRLGMIKSLAVGDFTVNFGQGLIQWQSLAFKKSSAVLNIKRQSATLRPYNSAGEFNFHRGIGVTLQKKKWEATLFASFKKISANSIIDTSAGETVASSFLAGGYHRTASENDDRNNLQQTAAGAAIVYRASGAHAGINAVYYHFSKAIQKRPEPYNLFSMRGSSLANASIDYSYTWRNMHVFGEAAMDMLANTAFLNGLIISPDSKADISLVYRKISPAYRSLNANAFTENASPVNESGFYTGLSIQPSAAWKLDAYADIFHFPWLRYRVDAPSNGSDFLVQGSYIPNKQAELYIRYSNNIKMMNRPGIDNINTIIDRIPKKSLRLQTRVTINRGTDIQNRVELLWYGDKSMAGSGQGWLMYTELSYKPLRRQWQANARLQYFEADNFNARLYAFEGGMPYNFSIPFYYDKGIRYYINLHWDASKAINKKKLKRKYDFDFWARWEQTIYPGKNTIGSGLDEIKGNHRSGLQFQLVLRR